MTKILNIDALVEQSESRVVVIAGVSHPILDMSVENFIKINNMAEEADKKENLTSADRVNFLADTVLISIPSCSKDLLTKLSLTALNAIAEFVRSGLLPEETLIEEASAEGAVKKGKKQTS